MLYVLVPGVFGPVTENDVAAEAADARAKLAPIALKTVATLRMSILRMSVLALSFLGSFNRSRFLFGPFPATESQRFAMHRLRDNCIEYSEA